MISGIESRVDWPIPSVVPLLTGGEIHVWRASLSVDAGPLHLLEGTLANDELARARRFISDRDRNHFIAARGILRNLLGKYLACPPEKVEFVFGPYGKPAIAGGAPRHPIRFNLSHSNELVLIGIGHETEIGVDVEYVRPEFSGEEITRRYFSDKEIEELATLPKDQKAEGFFLCWTRKEAFIKAKGNGLQIPLKTFTVTLSPDAPARLSTSDNANWSLHSVKPQDDYVAAIVAEGADLKLRLLSWVP